MSKLIQYLCLILVLQTYSVLCLWEYAVTTKTKILFYNDRWQEVTTEAHQFDQLSAITFDETEEIIYFNDQLHSNGSIFSLRIPTALEDPKVITKVVQRTAGERITSIAYDPLNRNLFWADDYNKKIYFLSIDAAEEVKPQVLVDFIFEDAIPDGIALDICRRKLYWTNSNLKNASVERINLDGSGREVLLQTGLYLPHGIVVDQLSDRIYWVDDQQGEHYSVESANLDGSDRQVIIKALDKVPFSLAVTKDAIFWTDFTHNAIWGYPKHMSTEVANGTETSETAKAKPQQNPVKVISFSERPYGVLTRTNFFTKLQNDEHCAALVSKIKNRLLTPKPTRDPINMEIEKLKRLNCVNGGSYSANSELCICRVGFSGARCEINECHNYCVHGTCAMSSLGYTECACQKGFYGERCETSKCAEYCFNDGICKIDSNGEPNCECRGHFGGQRCEQNSTEICGLFCRILKHEPETYVPFGCHDICTELARQTEDGEDIYAIPEYTHLEVCKNVASWNSTVIIVLVCGITVCLSLVLAIVHGLRKFYKPARPWIKKRFVVSKRTTPTAGETPLTNRPIATEQCEITIENCCNMNICDTPCFDPKLVQQTLSCGNSSKEDRKMLITNMEDELY